MDFDKAISTFDQLRTTLINGIQENMEIAAMDAILMMTNRVQEKGLDSNEQPFKPYTPRYQLFKAGLTKKKIAKSTKKLGKILETGVGIEKLTPKLLDRTIGIAGKYRGFVNLTLTGDMIRNVQIVERKNANGEYIIVISGSRKEVIDKLEGNEKQGRTFLALSKKEQEELRKDFTTRLEILVDRILT